MAASSQGSLLTYNNDGSWATDPHSCLTVSAELAYSTDPSSAGLLIWGCADDDNAVVVLLLTGEAVMYLSPRRSPDSATQLYYIQAVLCAGRVFRTSWLLIIDLTNSRPTLTVLGYLAGSLMEAMKLAGYWWHCQSAASQNLVDPQTISIEALINAQL